MSIKEQFDRFPSNLGEMMGQIPRKAFTYKYNRFEVWQGGKCVFSGESENQITSSLIGKELHVTIDDNNINEVIKKNFSFSEISTNLDRIMWSKDIFNQKGIIEKFNPDICSMFYKDGTLAKVTFTIHDPNILIEFYSDRAISNEPEIISLSHNAITAYQNENPSASRSSLVQIFRSVKYNPSQLKQVQDFKSLGTAFLLMLDQQISDDIDNLQLIVSVGYLCISKAIKKEGNNPNLIKDRLLLLRMGHEPFTYTVMNALDIGGSPFGIMAQMAPLRARDAIYRMEISDLEENPTLYINVPLFKERKREFDDKIRNDFFRPEKSITELIQTGKENHEKLYSFLEKMVIENEDVDF